MGVGLFNLIGGLSDINNGRDSTDSYSSSNLLSVRHFIGSSSIGSSFLYPS